MDETEILFTELLGCDRLSLYQNRALTLDRKKSAFVAGVLKRRMQGVPLQYILGKSEFMGLEFKVGPAVLIPRPETEILVEAAIKQLSAGSRQAATKILDLGTGSGCIAVALAKLLPNVKIDATDISAEALSIARGNAINNQVEINFFQADLFNTDEPQLKAYDLIISNPPYIPTAEIDRLQPEIAYEPRIALDGGRDGLIFYPKIIEVAKRYLKNSGILMLEIGFGQAGMIKTILQNSANFIGIEIINDYQGIERVIIARKGK